MSIYLTALPPAEEGGHSEQGDPSRTLGAGEWEGGHLKQARTLPRKGF